MTTHGAPRQQRLHAIDAVWLGLEHGDAPVAIGSASRCEGPVPRIGEVRALVASRLDRMPRLGQVAVDARTWADVDVDLRVHVRREHARGVTVDEAVAALMPRRFEPGRPLWSLHVVDGLADADWALVWRLHHSIADGIGAVLLAGQVFDTAPAGGTTLPERVLELARARPPAPSGRRPGLRGTLHAAGAALTALAAVPDALASVTPAPNGLEGLTGALGPQRRWRSLELPLAEVKQVGRAHGGTVNDVVVTLVAGGWRRALLEERGRLPEGAHVRCLLPVSLRPPGDDSAQNEVSALVASLPVGLADPDARLDRVVRHLGHLKASRGYLAVPAILGLVDRAVPPAVQSAAVGALGEAVAPMLVDTVATNVPGPAFPLWVLGRRVRSLHPVIPVAAHVRATVGILSFDGTLDIGITAALPGGPDVDAMAAGMRADLQALLG